MLITFEMLEKAKTGNLVFIVSEKLELTGKLEEINSKNKKVIEKAFKNLSFTGKLEKSIVLSTIEGFDNIIITGAGKEDPENAEASLQKIGAAITAQLNAIRVKDAKVVVEGSVYGLADDFVAVNIAYGALLRSYNFGKYFTKKKEEDKPSLKYLGLAILAPKQAENKFSKLQKIAEAVFTARDYVSEPPNVLNPETYAELIKKDFKSLPIKVEILGEKEMLKLGMGSLIGVGQGSAIESKMVIMQYYGAKDKKSKPIAFVGKGVTFDTGGISLKPADGMPDMKYDMGGSAAVVGAMKALAGRKAKVNAIGVVGLVENMPDGNAQRPGDVVTSMSGQTIEVLNTDAEGRLVLADALWYTQQRFKPKFMIDLATLTGACVIALGKHRAGLMSNNDDLADKIFKAGEKTEEKVWRLPMGDEYDRQIDSKIADVQNISNMKGGGTITAAHFLERFVNKTPWAHLDIAGVAWCDKAKNVTPEGAAGFGVRLLDKLVEENFES
jgi:leucyl aminopeptidase